MAWIHFTSNLAPGEAIRLEQVIELHSALRERIIASTDSATLASQSSITDTGLITDRLTGENLGPEINTVSTGFLVNDTTTVFFSATRPTSSANVVNALWVAANSLGISFADFEKLWPSGGSFNDQRLDDSNVWNIYRKAIQLMNNARLNTFIGGGAPFEKRSDRLSTWAGAKTSFYADTPSSVGGSDLEFSARGFIDGDGNYSCGPMEKQTWGITIRADTIFSSGYDCWVIARTRQLFTATHVAATLRVDPPGGATYDTVTPGTVNTAFKILVGESLTTTGEITLDIRHAAYDDSLFADEFDPDGASSDLANRIDATTGTGVAVARPTWNYPAD